MNHFFYTAKGKAQMVHMAKGLFSHSVNFFYYLFTSKRNLCKILCEISTARFLKIRLRILKKVYREFQIVKILFTLKLIFFIIIRKLLHIYRLFTGFKICSCEMCVFIRKKICVLKIYKIYFFKTFFARKYFLSCFKKTST